MGFPSGIKRTKQREGVFRILEKAGEPLSATEICRELEKNGEQVWLSTVYRILDLFLKKEVVLKTTLLQNEMALYQIKRHQHEHYAVCTHCRKMAPIDHCPMEEILPQLETGFQVTGHHLEVYGLCEECKEKED